MVNLQGKRALITGGTRGVGALVATLLAQRGVRLALNYASNKERAEGTLKGLAGEGHAVVQGDAFTREGIATIVKGAKEALGGIDIVVSNAGWTAFSPNFNDISASTPQALFSHVPDCSHQTLFRTPTGCSATTPTSCRTCGSCRPCRTSSRPTTAALSSRRLRLASSPRGLPWCVMSPLPAEN